MKTKTKSGGAGREVVAAESWGEEAEKWVTVYKFRFRAGARTDTSTSCYGRDLIPARRQDFYCR